MKVVLSVSHLILCSIVNHFLSFMILYLLAFTLSPDFKHLDSRNHIFSLCAELVVDAQ